MRNVSEAAGPAFRDRRADPQCLPTRTSTPRRVHDAPGRRSGRRQAVRTTTRRVRDAQANARPCDADAWAALLSRDSPRSRRAPRSGSPSEPSVAANALRGPRLRPGSQALAVQRAPHRRPHRSSTSTATSTAPDFKTIADFRHDNGAGMLVGRTTCVEVAAQCQ